MPITHIELSRPWSKEEKERLAVFVHDTLVEVLKIPEHDRLIRITDYSPDNFFTPPNGGDDYALFQISLFPGRTLDAKRALYKKLAEGMQQFGIAANDTRVVLNEVPMDGWGIRGGQAGSDVFAEPKKEPWRGFKRRQDV